MSIVGFWAFFFGDGVGSDGSGNGNSASFWNGATQDNTGRVNLDGIDDYVEIADAPQYALQQGTIHASFTAAAGSMDGTRSTDINDSSLQALFSRDSQGYDTGGHLTIYLDGDGSIWVRHQSATQDYFIRTAANTVQAGREFDLTYAFSDTEGLTLYVDGIEVGSNVSPVTNGDSIALAQNSEPWTLGASQSTSGNGVADVLQQHFAGKVGHFEIYDQALAPSELNTLHDLSDGVDDGRIIGTAGNDTIHGGNAIGVANGGAVINDTIDAGAGDDVVFAGDGDDLVEGGSGNDRIDAGSGADKVRGGLGNDTIAGGVGNDTLEGGAGDDIINGEAGDDRISGGEGADLLYGAEGNDIVHGGSGNDVIYLGAGNDSIFGDGDSDHVILLDGFGTDTAVGGELGNDTDHLDFRELTSSVSVTFTGSEAGAGRVGLDQVTFSEFENFWLTEHNDSLDGSNSASYMGIAAGAGNDTITTGAGDDIVLGQAGDDLISGGAGNDTLDGGLGHDTLKGGAGNDSLDGGEGNDSLTGGLGNDRFNVSRGHDTISDFNTGNTGPLGDGDSSNNDFLNLGAYYDSLDELRADQADDGILNQSNAFDDEGKAVDYSNNTRFGPNSSMRVQNANANTYSYDNTGIVCFAAGTRVLTPKGEVPIETLKPGDLVNTLDHGPQPLLWIGTRQVSEEELTANEELRPVRIAKGAMGNTRDLLVSRQHGMMMGPDHLVRAIHLAREMPGVRIANGKRKVTYVHLFFARHEIVFAEGIPSESFYPGPEALKMMSPNERAKLLRIAPALDTPAALRDARETENKYGKPARAFAKLDAVRTVLRWAA